MTIKKEERLHMEIHSTKKTKSLEEELAKIQAKSGQLLVSNTQPALTVQQPQFISLASSLPEINQRSYNKSVVTIKVTLLSS